MSHLNVKVEHINRAKPNHHSGTDVDKLQHGSSTGRQGSMVPCGVGKWTVIRARNLVRLPQLAVFLATALPVLYLEARLARVGYIDGIGTWMDMAAFHKALSSPAVYRRISRTLRLDVISYVGTRDNSSS